MTLHRNCKSIFLIVGSVHKSAILVQSEMLNTCCEGLWSTYYLQNSTFGPVKVLDTKKMTRVWRLYEGRCRHTINFRNNAERQCKNSILVPIINMDSSKLVGMVETPSLQRYR